MGNQIGIEAADIIIKDYFPGYKFCKPLNDHPGIFTILCLSSQKEPIVIKLFLDAAQHTDNVRALMDRTQSKNDFSLDTHPNILMVGFG